MPIADILRSIPAISWEISFSININLNALSNNFSCHFLSSILKILSADFRTAHTECIDNNRNLVFLNMVI